MFRFLARPRRWHPAVILGLLATSFATKETTYITVFIGGIFLIGLAVWEIRSGRTAREGSLIRAVREIGRDAWIWGVAAFAAVFTLLFTTFLTNPHGLQDGIVESIRYWLTQQPVNRGGQPWFYYLVVLPAYEWPVLLFAAIGAVTVVRRRTVFGLFLIWVFVANLVVFSWASERMPWLVLHMLLPAMLLAGLGVQATWNSRNTLAGKAGLAVAGLGVLVAAQAAVTLAYVRPADPRELLVYTQTSTDVPKVADDARRPEPDHVPAHAPSSDDRRRLLGRNRLAVELVPPRSARRVSGHRANRISCRPPTRLSSPTQTGKDCSAGWTATPAADSGSVCGGCRTGAGRV